MQVSVETTSPIERKMTVEVPSESIEQQVAEKLKTLAKNARINGFRPGKVPFKVVKKRFEPQVRGEVLGDLINSSFREAVEQEELRLAGMPEIEPLPPAEGESEGDEQFRYAATFEVYPEFEPRFDSSISIEQPSVEIQNSDVEEMLESLLDQRTEYQSVEREAQDGDQLKIDFIGSIDGEPFEGGAAEDTPLVLGSGAMIEGFESQLIGTSAGDTRNISVTFPENYGHEPLAGKDAQFDVTIHSVSEPRQPELTEELIKSFGIEDGTRDSLLEDLRKNMARELKQRTDARVKQQVMDGLLDLNEIEVPKSLIQYEIDQMRERLLQQVSGMEASQVPELPDDMFSDEAAKRVRLGLVIGEIASQHGLKPEASAIREHLEDLASTYDDPQAVIDYYYSNKELMQNIEGLVLEEAVVKSVLEKATVNDKVMSFQEIMNPPQSEADADESQQVEPG